MRFKITTIIAVLSTILYGSFPAFSGQDTSLDPAHEKAEIIALQDEVVHKVNTSGPRSEISRDVTEDDIDFDRAYRVYANSELFDKRTDNKETIKKQLQQGRYLWQIPVFIEDDTVLVDIFKNTEISDDIPERVKESLRETLGQWQVGAMYAYDNRIVDFQTTVKKSLAAVELDAEDYTYEFVSGLPGIRYPIAIVFNETKAMYMIPAASTAALAFEEGCETMEYTALSSNAASTHENNPNVFPVYHFKEVAKASRNASFFVFGSGIGISPHNAVKQIVLVAIMVSGVLGVGFAVTRTRLHRKRSK